MACSGHEGARKLSKVRLNLVFHMLVQKIVAQWLGGSEDRGMWIIPESRQEWKIFEVN